MARRSKYTPETVDKITQAIRLGATYQLACNFAHAGAERRRRIALQPLKGRANRPPGPLFQECHAQETAC